MSNVKTANSIPEAIDTFIKKNFSKLNDILMKGLEENNNDGCLYIQYKESDVNVDVSFFNKENIQNIPTLDNFEGYQRKLQWKYVYN